VHRPWLANPPLQHRPAFVILWPTATPPLLAACDGEIDVKLCARSPLSRRIRRYLAALRRWMRQASDGARCQRGRRGAPWGGGGGARRWGAVGARRQPGLDRAGGSGLRARRSSKDFLRVGF